MTENNHEFNHDAEAKIDEAKDDFAQAADDAKESAGYKADEAKAKAEEVKAKAGEKAEEVKAMAGEKAEEAKAKAEDAKAKLGEKAEDVKAKAGEFTAKLDEKLRHMDAVSPKELGDMAVKFASDTAYAAAGLADVVAEKAREFSTKQRSEFADTHGEGEDATKAFLDNVNVQFAKFMEDVQATVKDLADRGRDAVAKKAGQPKPTADDAPGMFDVDADEKSGE